MRKNYDVVIVGGGASGMVAACELGMSSPYLAVAILEKNDAMGRKIRATGSGRCNITNTAAEGYNEIMAFFRKIGLVTRTYDNGLVYPYSESAADVVELLESLIRNLGIDVITEASVNKIYSNESIIGEDSGFLINFDKKDADGTPMPQTVEAG